MISKRSVLGIACAALMSIAVVMPAAAAPGGNVNVGGKIKSVISLTIDDHAVSFGVVDPNNPPTTPVSTTGSFESNVPVNFTVCGVANSDLALTHLQWASATAGVVQNDFTDCATGTEKVASGGPTMGTAYRWSVAYYLVGIDMTSPAGNFSYTTTFLATEQG